MDTLQNLAASDTVENVYLFVADSVRERATSGEIQSLGVSGRAIAASTYTASSLPSILSGQYPATHRVWSFDSTLSERPALLSGPEQFGMSAETIWTDLPPADKPPFRMVGATNEDAAGLDELTPPFVAVEHHKGGHMPYGYSFADYPSTADFFEEQTPALSDLPALYDESVGDAEQRFLTAVDRLEEHGLLEETLLVYTSDHGEALGEAANGATIGHGDPITPDLVDVPVVFAGAGLPDRKLNRLVSGTDIAPTALSALGRSGTRLDGQNLWSGTADDRLYRSERWVQFDAPVVGDVDRYKTTSVWDEDGGIVFHRSNRFIRLGLAVGNDFVKAPWAYLNRDLSRPSRLYGFLRGYASSILRHGEPGFTDAEAVAETEPFRESTANGSVAIDREQLRKLGYLE